ncbi:MAG: MarR family transcriptional regulator [Patescibacteria group bacterium]
MEPRPRKTLPSSPDEELFSLMFEMGRVMKRCMVANAKEKLTPLHVATILFIEHADAPDMRAVSEYLRISSPSATRLVSQLVEDGLLARTPDPLDRRRVLLSLATPGKKFLDAVKREHKREFLRLIAPLSVPDRTEFARILATIISHSS